MRTSLSSKLLPGLAIAIGLGLQACAEPDLNITEGSTSYGALATTRMSEYFYPREAGWKYVYSSSIEEYNGGSLDRTVAGGHDTLRTLGFQNMYSPSGDSMFAFSVTYRVLASKNTHEPFDLHYVKKANGKKGGFIVGNDPAGFANVQSISTSARAIDTILYVVEGPTRDVIDNYNSTATREYRTDKIFFTAHNDSVVLWYKEGNVFRRTRQVWYQDFERGDEWRYGLWENSTYSEVRDENSWLTTDAGTYRCAKIDVYSTNINTETEERKWYGFQSGLIQQRDVWHVTTNGRTFHKRVRTRVLISAEKS